MPIPKISSRYNPHIYRYASQRAGRPRKSPVEKFEGFCAAQVTRVTTTIARLDEQRRSSLRKLYQAGDIDPTIGIGAEPLTPIKHRQVFTSLGDGAWRAPHHGGQD